MSNDQIEQFEGDNFGDRLLAAVTSKRSALVLGLDPRPEFIPDKLKSDEGKIYESTKRFSTEIIDAVSDLVCAVKIQVAFFEQYGSDGYRILADIIGHARSAGLIVIADVKRGDIGSTSDAYAASWLARETPAGVPNGCLSDAVTLSPYLGRDSIDAFSRYIPEGRGLFVLCRTSNPSAPDIQDLETGNGKLWEHVASLIHTWGEDYQGKAGLSALGAVVGATYPEDGARAREILPDSWFLVPGIGAQGGRTEDAALFARQDGTGAIFSVSRGIIHAYMKEEYKELGAANFSEAARRESLHLRDRLRQALKI